MSAKGSETAAILELLRGHWRCVDAWSARMLPGCQREMAGVIRERGAEYLLAIEGNQPSLRQALDDAVTDKP